MSDYVIVGNGVAGTRAAEVLRRSEEDAGITVVTEEPYPFYRRPQLADFAAGSIGEARLWGKRKDFYEQNRIDLRLDSRVTEVDPGAQKLFLNDGESLSYDRLLVAAGRRLGPEGLGGPGVEGVNCFKTLDEARAIREMDGKGRRGVVYGDGLVALEMVRALTGAGFATTYVVPGERLWPDVLDEEAAQIAASRVRAAGAEIRYGAGAEGIDGGNGRATGLVIEGAETIPADVVGVCAGYMPNADFLPGGGESFTVDSSLATKWDAVYAAGDVTVPGQKPYFNWLRSWRQGGAAGRVLAGEEVEPYPEIDVLNMQVLGLSLVSLGRTVAGFRSGLKEMRGDYPYGEFYKKLVFDNADTLVGALLVGNIAEAGALEEAIRARTPRNELDGELLHQMFDVTYRTSYLGVQCPVCRHEIQLGKGAQEGDVVTCPVCGVELVLNRGARAFQARLAR